MNQEEFKEYFVKADAWLYKFYSRAVYHMGEHPSLFWILFVLALVGGGALIVWVR